VALAAFRPKKERVSCFLILHLQTSLSKLISIHFKVVLGGLLASWSTRSKTSDTARCSGQAVGKPRLRLAGLFERITISQLCDIGQSLHKTPVSRPGSQSFRKGTGAYFDVVFLANMSQQHEIDVT
jgi:hypothetical protein